MTADDQPVLGEITALRRELKLTWTAHEREHTQHEAAHAREHAFAQQAIDKAAEIAKENKADANEWRAAMTDREKRFATKDDTGAIMQRLDTIERGALVAATQDRSDKEAAAGRTTRNMWIVGLMAGGAAVLVNLLLRLSGQQ